MLTLTTRRPPLAAPRRLTSVISASVLAALSFGQLPRAQAFDREAARALPSETQDRAAAATPLLPQSALAALRWRSVGPTRGGRSIAATGVASRPNEYYFGATGGGLWKSDNGGMFWRPVGDGRFRSSTVGAIGACEANPDVVYVGFGEAQLRGDLIPGDGVYKTADGGRTWTHLGLTSSTGQQTIGRLRVHPTNCDLVYAAVLGDPFGPNEERGVFRSSDGGRIWKKILYRNDRAGAVDLSITPADPRVIYAGFWEAYRKPWYLSSGGPGSGLFKSTDGGDTWIELSKNKGLPTELWGKVAVSVSGADPSRVYANIESRAGGVFVSDDAGATWNHISADRNLQTRGFYYTRITADPKERDTIYVNNEDFWRSRDGGRTWEAIPVPHGDNHDLWIDPLNNQRMIQANDGGANVSLDAGKTWTAQNYPTAQMYTVRTTSHFPYHICGSQQDQGVGFCLPSDGDGSYWYDVGGGESGWIVPDPVNAAIYYAGSQTSQLTRFDRSTGQIRSISPWPIRTVGRSAEEVKERFQWTFPVAISNQNPPVLYAGSQHLWRSRDRGDSWERISADLTYADPKTLGPSGGPITLDRTTVEHYATIFAIGVSPVDPNTIWTGSDDGLIHVTRDGGAKWENVTPKEVPKFSRVHFLEASPHNPGKALVAITRYRMQDIDPYIWKTEDYGQSWTKVVNGIPHGDHVRTVIEDPVRQGLLFAGTESGAYVSLDNGGQWQALQINLPVSPIYSLTLNGSDLVAATHGRGFWVMDDITPLRQLATDTLAARAHLFRPADGVRSGSRPTEGYRRVTTLGGVNIYYHLSEAAREVKLEILDAKGALVRELVRRSADAPAAGGRVGRFALPRVQLPVLEAGLNMIRWDLRYPGPTTFPGMMLRFARSEGPAAPPGAYRVRLTVDGKEVGTESLTVKKDPRLPDLSAADFEAQHRLAMQARDKNSEANEAILRIRAIRKSIDDRLARGVDAATRRAAEETKGRMAQIEGEIYEVRLEAPEDQLNFGLKLNNDLAVLQLEIDTGDGPPNAQQRVVLEELSQQLAAKLARLEECLTRDIPLLNRMLQRRRLEPVSLHAK